MFSSNNSQNSQRHRSFLPLLSTLSASFHNMIRSLPFLENAHSISDTDKRLTDTTLFYNLTTNKGLTICRDYSLQKSMKSTGGQNILPKEPPTILFAKPPAESFHKESRRMEPSVILHNTSKARHHFFGLSQPLFTLYICNS